MADFSIALNARAPKITSYGELVNMRDQANARRNALAMQQQTMQQNAMTQQKARATEAAMAQALPLANAGDYAGAEARFGLGAGNLEVHAALSKLSDEHRALVRSRFAAAAPIAIQALQEPDMGKRAALVQAAAPMLVQNGWKPEEIAQFQPTDQALSGIINNARTTEEALKLYDKQNEAYTLTPGSSRFVGNQQIANVPANLPQGQVTSYVGADGKPQIMNVVNGVAYPVTMGDVRPGSPMGGASSGGALSVDALRGPIVAQESGGNYGAVSPKGALGAYQLMPPTAKSLAGRLGMPWKPELMTANTPEAKQYQDALGGAAIQEAVNASGGDLATAAKYYHGGSNRAVWGPKTEQYARDIAGRMGGGGNAPTAGEPLRPVPTATELKLQGKEREAHRVAGAIGVKMDDSIRNVDALLKDPGLDEITGNWRGSVPEGLMALTSQTAANALAKYKTIAANATISELQELRASSPTGGALGQVSDYEDKMLRDAAATIARTQDLASFKKALLDYRNKLAAAKTRIEQSYAEDFGHEYGAYNQSGGVPGPRAAAPTTGGNIPASAIQHLRQNPSLRDAFDAKYGKGSAAKALGGR